jgi:hypothetical protein
MFSLFLKCLLGALAVLVIALLSRSRSFFIAGLVPLFPTFALIAHYIVGSERPAADLRKRVAPTLFTSCNTLPPEGATRLWPGKAGSTAHAGWRSHSVSSRDGLEFA